MPTMPDLFLTGGGVSWFKRNHSPHMLLGEGVFKFTSALTKMSCSPAIASTNARVAVELRDRGYWERVDATRLHLDLRMIQALSEIKCFGWNFPLRPGSDEDTTANENVARYLYFHFNLLGKGSRFCSRNSGVVICFVVIRGPICTLVGFTIGLANRLVAGQLV